MSPSRFLPEALGPGCAFLDYDNDGWMDIFLVNSGPSDFWKPSKPLRNALYKNNRDGTFTDVTEKAGVAGAYFGMGVAVGDYDNDGWPDMLVTSYGRCILYKNNHDGTFADVTEHAGVATPGFTTSAVWFDYDNDGRLDLFVCSFVDPVGCAQAGVRQQPDRQKLLLCAARVQAECQLSLSQQRRRHLHRRHQGNRDRVRIGEGPRSGCYRPQQRRPYGSVCRQRHGTEFSIHESRSRGEWSVEVGGDRLAGGCRFQR